MEDIVSIRSSTPGEQVLQESRGPGSQMGREGRTELKGSPNIQRPGRQGCILGVPATALLRLNVRPKTGPV